MRTYIRLTIIEREEISRQLAQGKSIRKIAHQINRTASSVAREIRRNAVEPKYYRAIFAQQRANKSCRKPQGTRKLDANPKLREFVYKYLNKKWSPQQIAKRLKKVYPDNMDMHISHESIYSYLYVLPRGELKRELTSELRRHHRSRRKRKEDRRSHSPIQDYFSIEERPVEVANRIIPGHWEGDLLLGGIHKTAIGTLVERTTRMTFLVKLPNKSARTVRKAFAEVFMQMPKGLKKTLTYDQGGEMSEHKLFTKETDITVYFAHPQSPWERGTNENTNGLLRQYFPKNTDFTKVGKARLKEVQDEFNDRPRKVLDWDTPHERFVQLLQ
ncbi:MAG: IS30 family transposase [Candidatus Omnitrophica bacterium]|nr:IS30 family transposase [Candidatus Omnitrophota bacterium]